MSRLDDIGRDLNLLRREVGLARSEADAAAAIARSISRRRSNLSLADEDVMAGWKRLSPDARPAFWDPRQGRHEDQGFGSSLQDRLASGAGAEGVVGADQASLGRSNILLDPLINLPVTTFTVPTVERTLAYGWDHNFFGIGDSSTLPSWFALAVSGNPNVGVLNAGGANSPFSSATIQIQTTGSTETLIRSASTQIGLSSAPYTARWLAGRIGYAHLFADGAAPSLKTLTIELYDVTAASVRASQAISLLGLAVGTLGWLDVNYEPTTPEKGHDWQFRVRFKTTGGSGVNFYMGDPILVWSASGSVPDYQPKIGRATSFPRLQHNNPNASDRSVIEAYRQSLLRFQLYDNGKMEWGGGTFGPDNARLAYSSDGERGRLTLDADAGDDGGSSKPVTLRVFGSIITNHLEAPNLTRDGIPLADLSHTHPGTGGGPPAPNIMPKRLAARAVMGASGMYADAAHQHPVSGSAVSSSKVRKNSAGATFTRSRINFIEGANIALTVADDGVDDEVDVTITGTVTPATSIEDNLWLSMVLN